jgi:bifunctional N-acetylglucosamine-1-phosphate-uridyltransferase/glucosamine-1-phosphate-acetyltransferase GlmU-like protein
MSRTNRLIILAGGISSRMKASITADPSHAPADAEASAKSMIIVGPAGKPLMEYLLDHARRAGLDDITILVNEQDRLIRPRFTEGWNGLRIGFAVQRIPVGRTKPLGTADAVEQALRSRDDWRGASFLVCNSDNLYSVEAFAALASLGNPGGWIDYDIDGLGFSPERIAQFGITVADAQGYLTDIVEKPSVALIEATRRARGSVRVSMNIWRFDYDTLLPFLAACPLHPIRDEKELPAAVRLMVARHPHSMLAVPVSEPVPDLTRAEDIPIVTEYLSRLNAASGSKGTS